MTDIQVPLREILPLSLTQGNEVVRSSEITNEDDVTGGRAAGENQLFAVR